MTTQERDQLIQFLQQLTQAQALQKDGEADMLIRDACLRQPDAAYLLVQRSMLLDRAVQDAQAQIAHLQAALEQSRIAADTARSGNGGGSFLDANAWGNSAVTRPSPLLQTAPCSAVPRPLAPPVSAVAPAPSAWGAGMLGNIATTAAGVVAGGFLFQGIGHLLGNHAASGLADGTMNGLRSDASTGQHAALAGNAADNSGVFDTGSVDHFIAGDMDQGDSSDDSV